MMMEQQLYLHSIMPANNDSAANILEQQSNHSESPCNFDSYNSVSSFNLPSQPCATVLTPNSSHGSPHLEQATKFGSRYPTPPATSASQYQELTPPETSRMYGTWSNAFDVNGQASQASSPTNQSTVAQEMYEPYESTNDGRRTPGPPERTFLGGFGVSDPSPLGHSGSSTYFMPLSHEASQHHPSVPIRDPAPLDSRTLVPPLVLQPSGPFIPGGYHNPHHISIPSRTTTRARTQGGVNKSGRQPKKRCASKSKSNSQDPYLPGEFSNCHGEEIAPTLKRACPDEEKCIFESRWKHRSAKGNDMWDAIQADYEKKFGKCPPNKEALQMKFKRARVKYIEWLDRDVELMREAWLELEAERYEALLQRFLKKGGSRNMLLNATDVEVKIVNDLKLEEGMYMESFLKSDGVNIRRRKAKPSKKRTSSRTTAQTNDPVLKHEFDEDIGMCSEQENEVIRQVEHARQYMGGDAEDVRMGEQTDSQWGPGIGMLSSNSNNHHHNGINMPTWSGGRQGITTHSNAMPPPPDHLIRHGNGMEPTRHKRQN